MTIPGFSLYRDVISVDREAELVAWIERLPALPMSKRHRLDIYGSGAFAKAYNGRHVDPEIPETLRKLSLDMTKGHADVVAISEYLPGQGVVPHTDRPEAGAAIATLSLLSDAQLVFRNLGRHAAPETIYESVDVPRRSLFVISGECRLAPWKHSLEPVRERRLSIAFRGFRS